MLQAATDAGVLDFINLVDRFGFEIADMNAMRKEGRKFPDGDVKILVDRSAEDFPAVFLVMTGIIGASSKKTDAYGRPGNDHGIYQANED